MNKQRNCFLGISILALVAAIVLGVFAYRLHTQKERADFLTVNAALFYAEAVLATMEEDEPWDTCIAMLDVLPTNMDRDRGDNQAIGTMLRALSQVWGDDPNRPQIMEELEKLKISRDTKNATFTVLEGDVEKIIALCREE